MQSITLNASVGAPVTITINAIFITRNIEVLT